MRLPWPFGRHSTEGPSAAAGAPADGLAPEAGPDTADPAVAPLAPPTGAWARLPAIQRTVGDVPVVAPARPFLAGVPGARPLPPIVEPLGHEVTPLAPAGLIAAPPSPVASLTSHAPLTPRSVQRHASGPDAGAGAWTTSSVSESSASPAVRDAGTGVQLAERRLRTAPRPVDGDARARAVAPERRDVCDRERPDSAAHASTGDARPGRAADRGGGHAVHRAPARRRAGTRDARPRQRRRRPLDRPAAAGRSIRRIARAPPRPSRWPVRAPASARRCPRRRPAPSSRPGRSSGRSRRSGSRRRHPRDREPRLLGLGATPTAPVAHAMPTAARRGLGAPRTEPPADASSSPTVARLADLPSLPLATRPASSTTHAEPSGDDAADPRSVRRRTQVTRGRPADDAVLAAARRGNTPRDRVGCVVDGHPARGLADDNEHATRCHPHPADSRPGAAAPERGGGADTP